MADHSWWHNALVLILTMREEDALRWHPGSLVEFAQSFAVDALGFSVGGIVAFYPTEIPHHPRSRWLGGRDLVGETVTAAHRAGVRAVGRIDPSLASHEAFVEHPEWFARDEEGKPILVHGCYVTCPNGGYYHRHMAEVITEILARYPLDGLWANAAKFSPWHTRQCFCANCQRKFAAESAGALPREDWNDPVWRRYNEWRYRCMAEWVRVIEDAKNAIRPECAWMPLNQVGESWDFARPGGWDIDYAAPHQDVLVLECQRRYTNIWWPGLESRYLHTLEPAKPAQVTVSYFYPWWRFYHTPIPENRVWTAQIVAHGARPWLHVTGYLSDLFDRRGLDALRALFRLFKDHPRAYEGTRSRAEVALVYSRHTLDNYGGDDAESRYLDHFRGYYNAMLHARLPFDVLSDKRLTPEGIRRYRALVLPNVACMTEEVARILTEYVEEGGHLVTTFHTGLYDIWGNPRDDFALGPAMGVRYAGGTREGLRAAYGRIRDPRHPLVHGLGDTDVIPVAGRLCAVTPLDETGPAPLTLVPPVEGQVGSGISVPEFNQMDTTARDPLVVDHAFGRGRVIYFPWQPDWLAYRYGLRDLFTMLAQAVRMAPGWAPQVEVIGPGLLDVSLMGAADRLVLHLINLSAPGSFNSGVRRPMEEIIPLTDLTVRVRLPDGVRCRSGRRIVAGEDVAIEQGGGSWASFTIGRLTEFESVLLTLGDNT